MNNFPFIRFCLILFTSLTFSSSINLIIYYNLNLHYKALFGEINRKKKKIPIQHGRYFFLTSLAQNQIFCVCLIWFDCPCFFLISFRLWNILTFGRIEILIPNGFHLRPFLLSYFLNISSLSQENSFFFVVVVIFHYIILRYYYCYWFGFLFFFCCSKLQILFFKWNEFLETEIRMEFCFVFVSGLNETRKDWVSYTNTHNNTP